MNRFRKHRINKKLIRAILAELKNNPEVNVDSSNVNEEELKIHLESKGVEVVERDWNADPLGLILRVRRKVGTI